MFLLVGVSTMLLLTHVVVNNASSYTCLDVYMNFTLSISRRTPIVLSRRPISRRLATTGLVPLPPSPSTHLGILISTHNRNIVQKRPSRKPNKPWLSQTPYAQSVGVSNNCVQCVSNTMFNPSSNQNKVISMARRLPSTTLDNRLAIGSLPGVLDVVDASDLGSRRR